MNSLNEAFEDLIKDLYSAEKQVEKALPKAAKAAESPELRAGFEEHRMQTQGHIQRLEQVAEICGFKPSGKVCKAAQGLIEEMDEIIKEGEPSPVTDAMLICGGQKFEHYEIASYGTAAAWAELMGSPECAQILSQTLQEEEQTDEKLNQMAESKVNKEAMSFEAPERPARRSAKSGSTKSRSSTSRSTSSSRSRAKTTTSR
jgi:ferritin-like metal-binding protein YciE